MYTKRIFFIAIFFSFSIHARPLSVSLSRSSKNVCQVLVKSLTNWPYTIRYSYDGANDEPYSLFIYPNTTVSVTTKKEGETACHEKVLIKIFDRYMYPLLTKWVANGQMLTLKYKRKHLI